MTTPVATEVARKTEKRRFGMHPKLLLDVIRRQAGSLTKAVLEGVMNSVDAGASACHVTIAPNKVVIEDDGTGITERGQIEKFFETFGQPHEESEGKVYGTFRMGRGQMFAYGANVWRTGPFAMEVDVKTHGLDYKLKSGLKKVGGCRIEIDLYNELMPSELAETERTIKRWTQYCSVPVHINGEMANKDPAKEKWDFVTDEAYVSLSSLGTLSIYNLGVHTMDIGGWKFGTGGTIVSRKQLRVNFARNDIQDDCPVWRKIKPMIDAAGQKKIAKKRQLSDHERQRTIDLVGQGEPPIGACDMPLFTTVSGKHYSAKKLAEDLPNYKKKVTSCAQGNRVGDSLHQSRIAFCLADECLQKFGKDLPNVIRLAMGLLPRIDRVNDFEVVPFKLLAHDLDEKYDILDAAALSVTEKMWLDLAGRAVPQLVDQKKWYTRGLFRRLVIGMSTGADGWTDGSSYVAIDCKFLKKLTFDIRGFTALGSLLLHEMTHDGPDTAEHTHGPEFYEAFHDGTREKLGDFVYYCTNVAHNVIKAAGKIIAREELKDADKAVRIRLEVAKLFPNFKVQAHEHDESEPELAEASASE